MRKAFGLILGTVLFVGAASSAHAQTVVKDNSTFSSWGGYYIGGPGPNISMWSVATKFSTTGVTFDQIRFWGGEYTGGTYGASVYYQILNASGITMGSVIQSGNAALGRTSTGNTNNYDTYRYDYSVGATTLGSGDYFLSMHVAGDYDLYWQQGVADAGDRRYQYSLEYYGGWSDTGAADDAYQFLSNDDHVTPEPITMTLLGTGLAGVAAARRRRKKNAAAA